MQRVYGLKRDSIAGPVTRSAMSQFRCGCHDSSIASSIQAITVDAKHCRWQKDTITYAISSRFKILGNRRASRDLIHEGFRIYAVLTGLTFKRMSWNRADIRIGAARGPRYGFDGAGSILAWAEMPCSDTDVKLLAAFDLDESWEELNALAIWLHELGHLMGLAHSDDPADLMAPYYNKVITLPQAGDKSRLAWLYKRLLGPPEPPPGIPLGEHEVSGSMVVVPGAVTIRLNLNGA